jgi:hypothetical protein
VVDDLAVIDRIATLIADPIAATAAAANRATEAAV